MKTQKGISTFFAILVVGIVAIIGFTIVLSYQWIWVPEEEEARLLEIETPKDETADWKVYRNEEYGFEIKYPENFYLSSDFYQPSIYEGKRLLEIRINGEKLLPKEAYATGFIFIQKDDNAEASECSKPYYSRYSGWALSELLEWGLPEGKVINDISFYREAFGDCDMQACYNNLGYKTFHQDACYEIILLIRWSSYPFKSGSVEMNEERFEEIAEIRKLAKKRITNKYNQILSTFKFTE